MLKTQPGRGARFDFIQSWILHHADSPSGLRISGNLARAYFGPGEIGNPGGLPTPAAVKKWGSQNGLEVWYVESSDTYHLSRTISPPLQQGGANPPQ